jgi:uncharacterized repeat protein (TIGR02543 family)
MGQRFRLKADFDISGFSRDTQVILSALKKYGMILADNGSSWYISGAPDPGWNNDVLHELGRVTGSAFEAVDESSLMISQDSGQSGYMLTTNVNTFPAGEVAPDCSGGCLFGSGTLVQLVAVPAGGYVFSGWGGDCTGSEPSCSVSMMTARVCTANFTACADQPVRIGAAGFSGIQEAYGAAGENEVIRILASDLSGALLLDRSVPVTLQGGYGCGYGSNPSMSLISGSMTITGATVIVEKILIF